MNVLESWIILLTIHDRAGSTAAIASVFSGRGIQLDSFLGFGGELGRGNASCGKVLISFRAFPERVAVICRVLESLSVVTRLQSYRNADCPEAIREAAEVLRAALGQEESADSSSAPSLT
jgi:hypothetical protein